MKNIVGLLSVNHCGTVVYFLCTIYSSRLERVCGSGTVCSLLCSCCSNCLCCIYITVIVDPTVDRDHIKCTNIPSHWMGTWDTLLMSGGATVLFPTK